jgi:protein-S-isoprenylcysteine O-methyltransferase Ste14
VTNQSEPELTESGIDKMRESRTPWWRGARGEWYVVVQVGLIVLVFFGPSTLPGLPGWPSPFEQLGSVVGSVLLVLGGVLFLWGLFKLGANLTPLPFPKEHVTLVDSGPYGLVRHPIYGGGILLAYGWAFLVHGWLTIAYATIILVFLDVKSRREEEWLKEKIPEYAAYQRRVRKLIPFMY